MASYRAEIEVVAKGLKGINDLNAAVSKLNSTVSGSRQSQNLADKRTAAMVRLRNVGDQVRKLEEEGVVLGKAQLQIKKAAEALDKGNLATVKARVGIAQEEVKEARQELRIEQKITQELQKQQKTTGAGAGGGGRRGGGRGGRFQDIATGAGFPLLFGGGPAQALAGGIGGAVGGLGGSIIASAVVSQVEAFAQAAAKTGVALTSTGGTLDFVREKALFSSEENKRLAASLEEQGDAAGLAKLLAEEMALAVGNNGVKALRDLGDTTKETTRLWNLLTTQLFRLVSGPLNAFLKVVNQALGGITVQQQVSARKADLGPERAAALDARIKELKQGDVSGLNRQQIRKGIKGVGALSPTEARKQALGEAQFQVAATPLPITFEDEQRFRVKGKSKKERESRLPQLQAEVELQKRLSALQQELVAAKVAENPIREAALKMDIELEKRAAAIKQINLEKIPQEEKNEKIKLATLEADREIFRIQSQLTAEKARQAEKDQKTLDGLVAEQNLLQATLQGRKEEEQLEQRIKKILEDSKTLKEGEVRAILEGSAALKEQISLQEQMKKVYENIGMSIKTGVVDAISSAVDQTKSLAEVASNTLKNIANQLLDIGVNFALFGVPFGAGDGGGLLGGFFANGGSPPVGKPSVVGERGPELFVPRTSGTIVPNNQLGGATNIVVNVDAKGSNAQGGDQQGKQLGQAIGAAVQAELIKQKRPGGLLS